MKATLVSATSLAALLAFEVGLDVAIDVRPARAQYQSFNTNPSSLNFGYVLLNISGGTTASLAETVVNAATLSAGGPQVANNTITFSAVSSPFGGAATTATLGTLGSGITATNVYRFMPTVTGASSSSVVVGSQLTYQGFTNTYTATVPMSGTAVAPVQRTSLSMSTISINGAQAGTTVRIGTTATIAAITVSNIGDGNLASKTATGANLAGSLGAPSGSVFRGSGGSFTLNDSNYGAGATTSTAQSYTYAPTAHTTDSATVVASFTNGSSAGTNAAQTTSLTLAATGVGPTYESKINGTTYVNSTGVGNTTVNAGTVSISAKAGATVATQITLANVSTDSNGGNASLTDLTLKSFSLSGANASDFSVVGFTTNTVLAEAQSVTVTLDFSGPTVGDYTANLSFATDEGSALGGAGMVFAYLLDPGVGAIPEPATMVTFGLGLAGLGWARRRRAKPANALVG